MGYTIQDIPRGHMTGHHDPPQASWLSDVVIEKKTAASAQLDFK